MNALAYGGTFDRKPTSTCYVSLWHIPGGCRYDLAEAHKFYFDEAEQAEQFAKRNEMPPEMAIVVTL